VRLSITFLGLDLLSVEVTTAADEDNGTDPGDCTSYKPHEIDVPDRDW
jgi:hypothetical protein